MNLENEIVQALGGLLSTAIIAGIGAVVPRIKKAIEAHTTAKESVLANNVLDGLSKIADSVVVDFNNRVVNDEKAKGGFTPQVAAQIKVDAVAAVKAQGGSFISLMKSNQGQVESLIGSLVEQSVSKFKQPYGGAK